MPYRIVSVQRGVALGYAVRQIRKPSEVKEGETLIPYLFCAELADERADKIAAGVENGTRKL